MQNESQGFGEKWKIKMGFGNKMENKDVGFRKTGNRVVDFFDFFFKNQKNRIYLI